jgi:hypothetical protein
MHDIPCVLDIPLVDSLGSTHRSNMEKSVDNPDSPKQDVEQVSQISSSSPDEVNNVDELDFKFDAKLILGILVRPIPSKRSAMPADNKPRVSSSATTPHSSVSHSPPPS